MFSCRHLNFGCASFEMKADELGSSRLLVSEVLRPDDD
jgi:hypothetical protein